MPYKSLQQLRDEQKAHSSRAVELYKEAAEIQKKMKTESSIIDLIKLQEEWLEKLSQARAETEKSIELLKQFIQELERLKNRNMN